MSYPHVPHVRDLFPCIYITASSLPFDYMDNTVGDIMTLLYFLNNLLIWMIFERKQKQKTNN